MPKDHPDLASCLNNLGAKLLLANSSSTEALKVFLWSWNCYNAIPFVRLKASIRTISLLHVHGNYKAAYRLSINAVDLLPRVHNRSLSRQD
jgi:hypothetical protein